MSCSKFFIYKQYRLYVTSIEFSQEEKMCRQMVMFIFEAKERVLNGLNVLIFCLFVCNNLYWHTTYTLVGGQVHHLLVD